MTAEQLITEYLKEYSPQTPRGFVKKPKRTRDKGSFLSGSDIAALSYKQLVAVQGRVARVIDVAVKGNEVSLTYVKGNKPHGKEITLVFDKADRETPVQYVTQSYDEAKRFSITKGMRQAMEKMPAKMKCPSCGLSIPVYPGRYPKKCSECGEEL